MEHELKCWDRFFAAIVDGRKRFEVRLDDRGFKVGDTLVLRETMPPADYPTGRRVKVKVTYLLTHSDHPGVAEGFVVMGIQRLTYVGD